MQKRHGGLGLGLFFVVRAVAEPFVIDVSDPATYRNDWGGPSLLGVLLALRTRQWRPSPSRGSWSVAAPPDAPRPSQRGQPMATTVESDAADHLLKLVMSPHGSHADWVTEYSGRLDALCCVKCWLGLESR